MFCNPDITCRQVSLDYILKRLQMLERLLVGHMVTLSVGRLAYWVQQTNTPTNLCLLVINDHMTNII